MKGDCHNKPIKYLFLQAENPPALDMHESTLLYIKQGLKVHKRAFSPVIIIGDHVYRVFFTHSKCTYVFPYAEQVLDLLITYKNSFKNLLIRAKNALKNSTRILG